MSKTIGVIGLGSIGMRHAKNLLAMGYEVIGWDPDETKEGELLAGGGLSPYDKPPFDFKNIIQCDGVVVASPTTQHIAHMERATHQGVPCLVEKPISDATDLSYVKSVLEVSAEFSVPIMMGNNLRFHSCVKKAKQEMAAETLGMPLWASFSVSQKNNKYKDPCILNWGAHEIDLALHLLGPATVTSAVGNDQMMDVCLLHEYGVPSTIHVDYVAPVERRGFCILGTNANMSADLALRKFILNGSDVEMVEPLEGSFDQDYKDEMQAFIDLIDGKPHPEAATGQDGLQCLELILEAKRMAEK